MASKGSRSLSNDKKKGGSLFSRANKEAPKPKLKVSKNVDSEKVEKLEEKLKQYKKDLTEASKNSLLELSWEDIEPCPYNRRVFKADETVIQSIKEEGVKSPLAVIKKSDGKYMLISGETRWETVKEYRPKDKLQCLVLDCNENDDTQVRYLLQLFNTQRHETWIDQVNKALDLEELVSTERSLIKQSGKGKLDSSIYGLGRTRDIVAFKAFGKKDGKYWDECKKIVSFAKKESEDWQSHPLCIKLSEGEISYSKALSMVLPKEEPKPKKEFDMSSYNDILRSTGKKTKMDSITKELSDLLQDFSKEEIKVIKDRFKLLFHS